MSDLVTKYLVFSIAGESYGISITKVREVIRHENITAIHDASAYMKGVINLRGKIIPVIDMRAKFGMEEIEYTDRTVFIIVEVTGDKEVFHLGIAVDAVHEVALIPDESIDRLPDVGFRLKSNYLLGIAKVGTLMIMILNIDRILSAEEIVDIAAVDKVPEA